MGTLFSQRRQYLAVGCNAGVAAVSYKQMKAPKLDNNKCSLLLVEHATGHVFKKDMTLYSRGDVTSDTYKIFDSFSDASLFAQDLIKIKPEFECVIFDNSGVYLTTFDITGERKK